MSFLALVLMEGHEISLFANTAGLTDTMAELPQYVLETLSTHHRRVFIKHEGKLIKTIPFRFSGKVVDPLW